MLKLVLTSSFVFLLSACAITIPSDIVQIGPNAYTLTGSSVITDNPGLVRVELIKEANKFCKAKGKNLQLLEGGMHQIGGEFSASASTINFSCY